MLSTISTSIPQKLTELLYYQDDTGWMQDGFVEEGVGWGVVVVSSYWILIEKGYPPLYWMLHAISISGVPSIAQTIHSQLLTGYYSIYY